MPWSGSGAADKQKDTTAGSLEEVHQRPPFLFFERDGGEIRPNAARLKPLQTVLRERGLFLKEGAAAVVWCVLKRVDDPRFPDTVLEVIEVPYQFSGYDPNIP